MANMAKLKVIMVTALTPYPYGVKSDQKGNIPVDKVTFAFF